MRQGLILAISLLGVFKIIRDHFDLLLIAFARQHEGRSVITAVPRLTAKLLGEGNHSINDEGLWRDTKH